MPRKRRPRRATTTCPQCAGEFPAGRLACPHCGSDAQTGWKSGSDFDEFTDDDYDEVVADLQGRDDLNSPKWRRRHALVVVTGLVIVALFVFYLLVRGSSLWGS
jgi:hypothetical protein